MIAILTALTFLIGAAFAAASWVGRAFTTCLSDEDLETRIRNRICKRRD